MWKRLSIVSFAAVGSFGCLPDVDSDLSLVDAPRVLAVAATPAEARPGESVQLNALVADPGGTVTEAPVVWEFCKARRPLAELGPFASRCLAEEASDALVPIGVGPTATATVPSDACRLFGPDVPPSESGKATGRPVDPDLTGGYQQPLRVTAPGADGRSMFGLRLSCGLARATQRQSVEYRRLYQANHAPELGTLQWQVAGTGDPVWHEPPIQVPPGTDVALRIDWTACPEVATCGDGWCTQGETVATCPADCEGQPIGCGGAEAYLLFDPVTLELQVRRESIAVAWYATAGTFEESRNGRASDDPTPFEENVWSAPLEPTSTTLWVVVRDDRGGATWRAADVIVQ